MLMKDRITKWRRDRWVGQVVAVGQELRKVEVSRAGVDSRYWPEDAAYLDARIDSLTRRRDGLLNKLKETA